jgi:hypothetical protein
MGHHRLSLVVGSALALTLLGRTLLWDRHGTPPLVFLQRPESIPSGIGLVQNTITGFFVSIHTTPGAEAFAVLPANRIDRSRQDHFFPDGRCHVQFVGIKLQDPDLTSIFFPLSRLKFVPRCPDQCYLLLDGLTDLLQASSTLESGNERQGATGNHLPSWRGHEGEIHLHPFLQLEIEILPERIVRRNRSLNLDLPFSIQVHEVDLEHRPLKLLE